MRRVLALSASCVLMASLGCGLDLAKEDGSSRRTASGVGGVMTGNPLDTPASNPATPATPEPAAGEQASDATPPQEPAKDSTTGFDGRGTLAAETPTVGKPSEDPNVETVAAKRGVGKTGRYDASGMIITPIKAYFLTKQRTELEIKVPQALQLYQAEHGHFPKTQEDFMRDIIQFNQIKLPELPVGHRYVYDPKTGELAVERPKD